VENVPIVNILWEDKMIMWNYRIIKEKGLFHLVEVFYEGGEIKGWGEPILGYYESRMELVSDLRRMLKDSAQYTLEVDNDTLKPADDEMNTQNK
jgi:hypothetical protein